MNVLWCSGYAKTFFFLLISQLILPCQAETTLFRVPLSRLAACSKVWADCIAIPKPEDDTVGLSDDSPMQVPFVSAREFGVFLDFALPSL